MKQRNMINIVTGVIGSDAHIIGNRILQIALEDAGFKVVGLGILVSQEEFIQAAVETNAGAILISSLYGMAQIDCQGFRDKCIESGLDNITLYVGGNLGLGKKDWKDIEKVMLEQGFNRAFPPDTMPEDVIKSLDEDLIKQ